MFTHYVEFVISQDLPEKTIGKFIRTLTQFPNKIICREDSEYEKQYLHLLFRYILLNNCWIHNTCEESKIRIRRALLRILNNNIDVWQKAEYYKEVLNL